MARIIDGRKIAEEVKGELINDIEQLKAAGCIPNLVVVLVGKNPASQIYVHMKTRAAVTLGIASDTIVLPVSVSEEKLLEIIAGLNADKNVHGILLQLPLPNNIDENNIINSIAPEKDVDGFHPINRGKLMTGEETFIPCTPFGIQQMLKRSGIETWGKHVVIVGRSNIVGLPLATIMAQKKAGANSTVTICHTATQSLDYHTKNADILIAAAGRPEVIHGNMIKEGAVVVDVGVNRVDDPSQEKGYRIVGDVEFEKVAKVASAITPVPGGVGPMTIAMLMHNTVKAAKQQFITPNH